MPTGSKDTGVLLDWLLDSMGLVRRSGGDESGALHRIMREAFLTEPLRGWDSKELGDQTGLSNTGIHHQMVKLRECGLVAAQVDGKWHRHVLRGGSMAAAISLVEAQAVAVLGLRTSELGEMVEASETRMAIEAEQEEIPFSIRISEPGPVESDGRDSALVSDLGLAGDSQRPGRELARDILAELCSSHQPITLLALSERLSESRGRVSTVVDRMRAAAIVERAPMVDRIPQDAFAGIVRQFDARGGVADDQGRIGQARRAGLQAPHRRSQEWITGHRWGAGGAISGPPRRPEDPAEHPGREARIRVSHSRCGRGLRLEEHHAQGRADLEEAEDRRPEAGRVSVKNSILQGPSATYVRT